MIRPMGRRRHAGLALLVLSLVSSGSAWAQAADESADSGWFEPEAEPSAPPAPSPAGPPPVAPGPTATAPAAPQPPPASDDADPRAISDFQPHLAPHGTWVEDSRYGTVWVPYEQSVGPGFAPYVSGGHWELATTGEWVWASDYPFGWIVFHYGRWVWTSGHGWAWIPGYRYAPAWVTWRVPTGGDAYIGWAPLGPDFIWVSGYPVAYYYPPPHYWVFCPSYYAFHGHVHYYIVRDRPLMTRLAYSTRHYAPARPGRVPASPTPADARVPASSLPRERVTLRPAPRNVAEPAMDPRGTIPQRERQATRPAPSNRQPVTTPTPSRPSLVPAPSTAAVPARPAPSPTRSATPAPKRPNLATERTAPRAVAPRSAPRTAPAVAPRPQQRTSAVPQAGKTSTMRAVAPRAPIHSNIKGGKPR